MSQRKIDDKNKSRKVDNPKDIELNKAEARVQEKEIARDMQILLRQPEFIRFAWRSISEAGVYREPFTGNSHTFFNAGKASQGRWLMSEIEKHSPRALLQIMEQRVKEIEKQQLKEMEN